MRRSVADTNSNRTERNANSDTYADGNCNSYSYSNRNIDASS